MRYAFLSIFDCRLNLTRQCCSKFLILRGLDVYFFPLFGM